MRKPDLNTVPPFYHNYINLVAENNLLRAMEYSHQALAILHNRSEEEWSTRYAPGKWSVKELGQHMIDTDRIFAYRALTFARRDSVELPPFDENWYAAHASVEHRSGQGIEEEYSLVRQSNLCLFRSFENEQLEATGIANGKPISVAAIGYIIAGHALHHINILKERYGL